MEHTVVSLLWRQGAGVKPEMMITKHITYRVQHGLGWLQQRVYVIYCYTMYNLFQPIQGSSYYLFVCFFYMASFYWLISTYAISNKIKIKRTKILIHLHLLREAAKKGFFSGPATEGGGGLALKNTFFEALKGLSGWSTKKTFFAASLRLLASPVLQNNYPSIWLSSLLAFSSSYLPIFLHSATLRDKLQLVKRDSTTYTI